MSEIVKYEVTFNDKYGKYEIKPGGVCGYFPQFVVKYEDYAKVEAERDLATLTHDYQQDQINYWQEKAKKVAAENIAIRAYLSAGTLDVKLTTEESENIFNEVRAQGVEIAINNLKALDASPFAIHSLECKLNELRKIAQGVGHA